MSKFYLLLAFDALLFGTIAMSLDLLMGYTGLVSFGHAAFFGLGAYASAVLLERGILSLWACLLFAILVVGLYALVVSFFSTARRGIYFALLTLIFAEVVYTFFRYTQTFGGSDGIQGVAAPRLVGALYPGRSAFATPDLMLWTVSGEFIIMVMIGGLGTLAGPVVGGAFFVLLQEKVSSYVDWYFIVIGLVLIFIVLFMPKGLLGIRELLGGRRWRTTA